MKNQNCLKMAGYTLALALAATAQANTGVGSSVQTFTFSTPLTTAGPDPLPSINGTWNIAQFVGLPADLQCVTLEITNRLVYNGTLVALEANLPFNLQVRSDFTVDFGATMPGSVGSLDPLIFLSGSAPATPNVPFPAPGSMPQAQGQMTTLTAAGDLAPYTTGDVPVFVTGNVLTTALAGYSNTTDQGPDSPGTFLDEPKVFPAFGFQEYQLESTLIVTYYFIPEAEASGATMFALGALWYLGRRNRR